MGKISGCSPEMHRSLWASYLIYPMEEDDSLAAGPTLRAAISSLLDERERRCMDDVTLIGPPDDDDTRKLTEAEGLFNITYEKLVVLRATVSKDYWDMGCVRYPDPEPGQFGGYIVSYGPRLMVWTSALSILLYATSGRMDGRRLWELVKGELEVDHMRRGIPGIDLNDEIGVIDEQDPPNTPNMEEDEVKKLEELGDIEKVRQALLWQGAFWIWLAPDRFDFLSKMGSSITKLMI
ncbi:hypothetical protein HWV62_12170 [Athelia sp. TMB]|nr:hypothetical protein HWV62_12170 [Athelia sp. TMB]